MSDIMALSTCFLLLSILMIGSLTFVVLRTIQAVKEQSGAAFRATDRERHDREALLMRLIDRTSSVNPEIARQHMQERMSQARLDAQTEQVAIQHGAPSVPSSSDSRLPEYTTESEAVFGAYAT